MSLTNKPGNPDEFPGDETLTEGYEDDNRTVPLRLLVLGGIAVILAVLIGYQVLGVLYVMVFPPAPPLPDSVTLVSHTSTAHGVDEWLYTSAQPSCEIVTFYIDNGAVCRIAPTCETLTSTPDEPLPNVENASQNVARCIGQSQVSIFQMRWQVIVAASAQSDTRTEFRLLRDMFWTGGSSPPEATPES